MLAALFIALLLPCMGWCLPSLTALSPSEHPITLYPAHFYPPTWKRAISAAQFELTPEKQFVWNTPNDTQLPGVGVILDILPVEDELIIDLAAFSSEVQTLVCTPSEIDITFRSAAGFTFAHDSWNWVNDVENHTIIIVEDESACGEAGVRRPWTVTTMTPHKDTLTVQLAAEQKPWEETILNFDIRWGKLVADSGIQKRGTAIDFEGGVSLPLGVDFPSEIWEYTSKGITIEIGCEDCGTTGSLDLSGEISSRWFDITKLELSARPDNVGVEINPTFMLSAIKEFGDKFERRKRLFTVPLPGPSIHVPALLDIGPAVDFAAGIKLDSVSGTAALKTGVSAKIQDKALAKVDLFNEQASEFGGWVPNIEFKPPSLSAEVTAGIEMYIELAPTVGVWLFDRSGYVVDLALKVPKLGVEIKLFTNANADGDCPVAFDDIVAGVEVDTQIGAALGIEGIRGYFDKTTTFLDLSLFDKPDIIDPAPDCLVAVGDELGHVECPEQLDIVPIPEEEEELAVSIAAKKRRSLIPTPPMTTNSLFHRSHPKDLFLLSRAISSIASGKPYTFECPRSSTTSTDSDATTGEIFPFGYDSGPTLAATGKVPIAHPQTTGAMACLPDAVCHPANWTIDVNYNNRAPSVVNPSWASEHIYERNWVRDFFEYLRVEYYNKKENNRAGLSCDDITDLWFREPTVFVETDNTDLANTIKEDENKGDTGVDHWAQALMQCPGIKENQEETMAVFPQHVNRRKYRAFAGNMENIDRVLQGDAVTGPQRACRISYWVQVCEYMKHPVITAQFNNVLLKMDKIFDQMATNSKVLENTPSGLLEDGEAYYHQAHRDFLAQKLRNGFHKVDEFITTAAEKVTTSNKWMEQLDPAVKTALEDMAANGHAACKYDPTFYEDILNYPNHPKEETTDEAEG